MSLCIWDVTVRKLWHWLVLASAAHFSLFSLQRWIISCAKWWSSWSELAIGSCRCQTPGYCPNRPWLVQLNRRLTPFHVNPQKLLCLYWGYDFFTVIHPFPQPAIMTAPGWFYCVGALFRTHKIDLLLIQVLRIVNERLQPPAVSCFSFETMGNLLGATLLPVIQLRWCF